ncbi:hypothetical protein IJS77_04075 [bacterium]|nr:hypothetical protein [bacterium]
MKKAFSLVEISFVLFVLAAVLFAVVPFSLSNVKQARFISEWKNYMEQISYSFETLEEYKRENDLDETASVKRRMHYLDAELLTDKSYLNQYRYKMMNGNFYKKMNINKFDEIYMTPDGNLMGVEYSIGSSPYATVWTDLNGKKKPNIVGNDIFIFEIYKNSIVPYGKGVKFESMRSDCSKSGTGMFCSQYYILGGDLK